MSDTVLLTVAASLVATLFGVLVALLGCMGGGLGKTSDEIDALFLLAETL